MIKKKKGFHHFQMEDFLNLFCEWYNINIPTFRSFTVFNSIHFEELWKNLWFAKNDLQKSVDQSLKKKYQHLFSTTVDIEHLYPSHFKQEQILIMKISQMILYDQLSRNIFRNTEFAYKYDRLALEYAQSIMEHWDKLPLPIKVSIVLVFIHSEEKKDLSIVESLLSNIKEQMLRFFPNVWISLNGIAQNHRDRMVLFGRIPERNKFLRRESTPEELSYLSMLGSK